MKPYDISFSRGQLWQFIIKHQYINVLSAGMYYHQVVERLAEEMGKDFGKPFVLLDLIDDYESTWDVYRTLDLIDYDFT